MDCIQKARFLKIMKNKKEYLPFVIFIIVNILFFMYMKKRGISYFIGYIYHFLVIYYCSLSLNKFQINFLDSRVNVFKKFFNGIVYGCSLAIAVVYLFTPFFEIVPVHFSISVTLIPRIINYFIFQFLVAISEELLFRFYLYEQFFCLGISKTMNILICSLIFSYGHFYLHSDLLQFGITFAVSLFLFCLKNKWNSCDLLVITHFIYNIVINFFVFKGT